MKRKDTSSDQSDSRHTDQETPRVRFKQHPTRFLEYASEEDYNFMEDRKSRYISSICTLPRNGMRYRQDNSQRGPLLYEDRESESDGDLCNDRWIGSRQNHKKIRRLNHSSTLDTHKTSFFNDTDNFDLPPPLPNKKSHQCPKTIKLVKRKKGALNYLDSTSLVKDIIVSPPTPDDNKQFGRLSVNQNVEPFLPMSPVCLSSISYDASESDASNSINCATPSPKNIEVQKKTNSVTFSLPEKEDEIDRAVSCLSHPLDRSYGEHAQRGDAGK